MLPLFLLQLSQFQNFKKFDDLIPELEIKIPVSVVFIGKHPLPSEASITPDAKQKWFKALSHKIKQKELNISSQFITNEPSKAPPLTFDFEFSTFSLPEEVNEAFESALEVISRKGATRSNPTFIIHNYAVETILQSIIDYYKIPGIATFVLNTEKQFYICEGLNAKTVNNLSSIYKTRTHNKYPLTLEINSKTSWNEQIFDLIAATKEGKTTFFSAWDTEEGIFKRMLDSEYLSEEISSTILPKKHKKCGRLWTSAKRFIYIDAFSIIERSIVIDYQGNPEYENELATSKEIYNEYCYGEMGKKKAAYCAQLADYIEDIKTSMGDAFRYTGDNLRYMSSLSSIIISALNETIAPQTPTFLTPFADRFEVSLSIINDTEKKFDAELFETDLKAALIPGTTAKLTVERNNIEEWPSIAIPLYARTVPFQPNDEIYGNITKGYWHVPENEFREKLMPLEVSHKPTNGSDGKIVREAVAVVCVTNDKVVFDSLAPSFAFDWVSLGLFSPQKPDHHPILRSLLTHMYGVTFSENWNSPTIMCPASGHHELGQLAIDAAYRSGLRAILGKGRSKIVKRISEIAELLDLADEFRAETVTFSDAALEAELREYSNSVNEILKMASEFRFDEVREALPKHAAARKEFTRRLKEIAQTIEDQLCAEAPETIVKKGRSRLDSLDLVAITISPVWIGLFFFSLLAALVVVSRRQKFD